jgi:DNA polymerase III subunit epsilon
MYMPRLLVATVGDAALADARPTAEERAVIIQLAGLFDLADLEVEALLAEARARELTALAEARGLVVWPAVKRGVVAVIAQDPGSGSGKARKARESGIPAVGEGVLG